MSKTLDEFMDDTYAEVRSAGTEDWDWAYPEAKQRWIKDIKGEEKLRELAISMVKTCHETMATLGSPRPIPDVDWFLAQLRIAQQLPVVVQCLHEWAEDNVEGKPCKYCGELQ